jgi:hypothetical protein
MENYTNHDACIERLLREYEEHGNLVVAFDFDDTLFDLHGAGIDTSDVIELAKECNKLNLTVCLWTAVGEWNAIHYKTALCEYMGIKLDYVNESPLLKNSKKPFFSILLDDRAGLESSYKVLQEVINQIKLQNEG